MHNEPEVSVAAVPHVASSHSTAAFAMDTRVHTALHTLPHYVGQPTLPENSAQIKDYRLL